MLSEIKKISFPKDVFSIASEVLNCVDREHLICMQLDTKNNINSISTISIGSINSTIAHPREIFKAAILSNSASIILIHNHPSNDTTPSNEDINMSLRVKEAGKILGIELLDHVVIGDNNYTSLKEKGFI